MSFVAGLGLVLAALVAWDAAVTVLHPDAEGLLAKGIRRAMWRLTALVSTCLPRVDRHVLGLAGPVIVAMTFVGWIVLITLGITLVVWPMLGDDFEVQANLGSLTFLDALYFASGTVTVLGYGDITPVSTGGQLISVFGAAIGFTMFTGMATYAIEIVSGLATRNRFTLAVHDDTRGGGGATMLAECLAEAGADETRERCRSWAEYLRAVDDMVHRYPLVAFTYRSHRDEYDPEPALRHVAEATVTALVAAGREPALRATAEALCSALTRLQCTIADKYLGSDIARRLADPQPTAQDRQAVANVASLLSTHLGCSVPAAEHQVATEAVHRCRTFLAGLHHWSRSSMPPHEWDD
jgi:hypothetical protein